MLEPVYQKILDTIIRTIMSNRRFLVVIHESPDGDAVGSMMALTGMLKIMQKDVTMFSPDVIPSKLGFLEGMEEINCDPSVLKDYDVMFMLDCGARDRAGADIAGFDRYKTLINIDHHISNNHFGDINFIDLTASCTGEHVYFVIRKLLNEQGIVKIPEHIALSLLCALYDDTGGMRYISTTSRTLRVAADIVDSGANCSLVSENLFFSVSRQRMELTRRVMQTLTFEGEGRIAYMVMTLDDLSMTGSEHEDSNGLIDIPRSIEGVEVGFIVKEMNPDKFKFSFRSRGKVDLNAFCSNFGGGGHKVAAGCTVYGNLEEVKNRILEGLRPLVN